jgi:nucleotide-binding universal stress UspA family protein
VARSLLPRSRVWQRILIAVDGSANAERVFQEGRALASCLGAEVHVFRAVSVPPELPPAAATTPDHLERATAALVLTELQQLVQEAAAVIVPAAVGPTPAWRAILTAAADLDVDAIVIGGHGHRAWDRILGSTAGRVVSHADRPVIVLRDKSEHGRDSGRDH